MNYPAGFLPDLLKKTKIVPVLTVDDPADALPICRALSDGGLGCAEVTMRTEAAPQAIKLLSAAISDGTLPSGFTVLAGTVLSVGNVRTAVECGAKGIVCPGFDDKVVSYCIENGIPVIPGVATASELSRAASFGLTAVKFFPAETSGGIGALKALSAPFPAMRFMPTGGINEKNTRDYLKVPSVICCGGSFMIPKDSRKDPGSIAKKTRELIEKLNNGGSGGAAGILPSEPKKSGAVYGFGEIMLRLSSSVGERLCDSDALDACYGGSEANTLALLAGFGEETEFLSAVPDTPTGDGAFRALRRSGIGTGRIIRRDGRLGLYFLEKGNDLFPSTVVYDRKLSLFSTVPAEEWTGVLDEKCGWFHFTGITPALSGETRKATEVLHNEAVRAGIPVSCDINYRSALWSKEDAAAVMRSLCPGLTLCVINEEAARLLGVEPSGTDRVSATADACRRVAEKYSVRYVAATVRRTLSQETNELSAVLYDSGRGLTVCTPKRSFSVTDRVGSGDCFTGGLIYSIRNGFTPERALDFSLACSVLKHYTRGDMPSVKMAEAEAMADRPYDSSDTGALIKR